MNGNTLKAVIKQYKDTPKDELNEVLSKDDRKFSEEDIADIIIGLSALAKEVIPNDNLDLSSFDYTNLEGEYFIKYKALIDSLNGYEQKDFEQYMASGVFKKELDENLNPREVLIGIKINTIKPINTTRIPVRIARDLNTQIMDRNNPASNSRYYLLKK